MTTGPTGDVAAEHGQPAAIAPAKGTGSIQVAGVLPDSAAGALGKRSGAESAKPRLDWIDGLRGMAAVAVMVYHFHEYLVRSLGMSSSSVYSASLPYFDLGKFAVVLFFLISGFVAPFSLRAVDRPVRSFLISRFFRLYPAYWLALLLAGLLGVAEVSGPAYLANFSMLHKFFGIKDAVGVFWTLQIELIFYGLCVALFLRGALWDARTVFGVALCALGCALLVAGVRYWMELKLPVALLLALFSMMLGLQCRLWFDGVEKAFRYVVFLCALFVAVLPAICLLAYSRNYGFEESWFRYLVSYLCAYAVFGLFAIVRPQCWRGLRYLGTISYSVYLLHQVVGYVFVVTLRNVNRDLSVWPLILSSSIFVVLFSSLSYFLVERPMNRLGRRLIHKSRAA